MPTRRPNILMIMCDQLAPQYLPFHGHPVVYAPVLSKLADEGVVFDSAYCNSPLCAPARSSLMTGRLCSRIEAWDNAAELRADVPTMAHYMRASGYRTVLSGKMHFVGPDQLHGYEQRLTTDIYPADFGWVPDWTADPLTQRPFWYHNMQSVVEAGIYERTLELDYDEEVSYKSVRQIYDMARDSDERPFFMTVSFIQPHDPYMVPRKWWDRYRHDEIDMPMVDPIDVSDRDPHSQRLYNVCQQDQYEVTDQHIRNARHAYYGMISWLDDQIAQLLDALRSSGLEQDTIVCLTSDHGDMLGERGMWYKMSFFEHSVRVPLVFWSPSRFSPARISEPVSLVDLLPTFAELGRDGGEVEYSTEIDGVSLVSELSGSEVNGRSVEAEYMAEGAIEPLYMLREGSLKYTYGIEDGPQLFDLVEDSKELNNLADSPEYIEVESAFRERVNRHWNAEDIKQQVLASQRRRRLVHKASVSNGSRPVVWDHQPVRDASALYNRNYANDLYDTDRNARIPRRPAPPADKSS